MNICILFYFWAKYHWKGQRNIIRGQKMCRKIGKDIFHLSLKMMSTFWRMQWRHTWLDWVRWRGWSRTPGHVSLTTPGSVLSWRWRWAMGPPEALEQEGSPGTLSTHMMTAGEEGPILPASNAGWAWPQEAAELGLESSMGFSTFIRGGPTVCPAGAGDTERNSTLSSMNANLFCHAE